MSDSRSNISTTEHNLTLNFREKLSITGVKEIINFDEKNVNVKTVCGELSIDGENIHINILNVENGELEVSGKINGLNYFEVYDNDRKTL